VRHHHDVRARRRGGRQFRRGVANVRGHSLGQAPGQQLGARVDPGDLEQRQLRQEPHQSLAHVAGTEDPQIRRPRPRRLEQRDALSRPTLDLHRPSSRERAPQQPMGDGAVDHVARHREPGFRAQAARRILEPMNIAARQAFEPQLDAAAAALPQLGPEYQVGDAHGCGACVAQQLARKSDRVPFEPPAADGAHRADRIDQHARAGLARRRAAQCGDRHAHQRCVMRQMS
jgi:hypothetical protein